jgi:hypothetical protein
VQVVSHTGGKVRFYISFGQVHAHSIDGKTYDKDSLMLIEAPGELVARVGVNQITGGKWCGIYSETQLPEMLHYFPRGVINADRPVEIYIEDYKQVGDSLIKKCDGNHGGPRCADPECWSQ